MKFDGKPRDLTLVEELPEPPVGLLFGNGNAMYFGEDGSQLPEIQKHGISGIYEFEEQFPGAPVFWGIWGESVGVQKTHENLKKYIREPEEVPENE